MSLHTYYVFFTIVSLKQRIQSNKSKKILLGVLEGQMFKNRPVGVVCQVAGFRRFGINFP